MKTAKDYYEISVLDGMLVTDKESVIEAIQMVIDDAEREKPKWIEERIEKPPFGEPVLVKCRIYGRFLATYEHVGDFGGEQYGNWRDSQGQLGILPPTHWMYLPE